MDIGNQIKLLRQKRKLTQTELGNKLGVLKSYISKIESGAQIPRIKQLKRICEALGVDLAYLILESIDLDEMQASNKEIHAEIVEKYDNVKRDISQLYFDQKIPNKRSSFKKKSLEKEMVT